MYRLFKSFPQNQPDFGENPLLCPRTLPAFIGQALRFWLGAFQRQAGSWGTIGGIAANFQIVPQSFYKFVVFHAVLYIFVCSV
jgi:hypothetical protein